MSWMTIHQGPVWEVDLLRGALEENGIPAFAPDANLKVLDPWITGPLLFDRRLQVPEELAGQATALIAELRRSAGDGEGLYDSESERVQAASIQAAKRVEGIGRRVCFASLLPITAPFALYGAWQYFRVLRQIAAPPRNHKLVVCAAVLSVLQSMVLLAYGWMVWGTN